MPLIYNSLECEHLPVQEKVLKTVPHLCEILDYGTVQNVLLVKVAVCLPFCERYWFMVFRLIADSVHQYTDIVSQGADAGMLHRYGEDPR